MIPRYQKAIDQAGGLTEAQKALAKADDDALATWQKLHKQFGDTAPTLDDIKSKFESLALK